MADRHGPDIGGGQLFSRFLQVRTGNRWDRYIAYNNLIGSIYRLYTGYVLPSRGLYNPYHLVPEPEKSIELSLDLRRIVRVETIQIVILI